jgi:glutathione S-transferase
VIGILADETAVDHGITFLDDRLARQEANEEMPPDARRARRVTAKQDRPAVFIGLTLEMPVVDFLHLPTEPVGFEFRLCQSEATLYESVHAISALCSTSRTTARRSLYLNGNSGKAVPRPHAGDHCTIVIHSGFGLGTRCRENPMYVLYGGDFTRSILVQWVLEEGGIHYDLRQIDILNGEHRAPDFLAINPAGLVPVLVTPEGDALYEVAALMVYLADRHELTDLAPAVADPRRGLFLSAVFYIASDIQAEMKRFHFPHRFSLRREDNAGIQALAKELVLSRLSVMNARLAKSGPYVLGDRFCLADFYLSFWIAYLDRDGVRERFPLIARLYDLVRSRPSATPYIEEAEKTADAYADIMRKHPEGVIA